MGKKMEDVVDSKYADRGSKKSRELYRRLLNSHSDEKELGLNNHF
jgi:hypothetical protein